MWGQALRELEAALDAKLAGAIQQVAAVRAIALSDAFTRYRWRVPDLQLREFPAVVVKPRADGAVQTRNADTIREAVLPARVGYGFQAADVNLVADQLEFVPEAIAMVMENLDELTDSILGIDGDISTAWDPVILRSADEGPFEGWVAVDADLGLYTDAIALA